MNLGRLSRNVVKWCSYRPMVTLAVCSLFSVLISKEKCNYLRSYFSHYLRTICQEVESISLRTTCPGWTTELNWPRTQAPQWVSRCSVFDNMDSDQWPQVELIQTQREAKQPCCCSTHQRHLSNLIGPAEPAMTTKVHNRRNKILHSNRSHDRGVSAVQTNHKQQGEWHPWNTKDLPFHSCWE